MLDYIFQQAVQRLPVLCKMLRYFDTDFPHDKYWVPSAAVSIVPLLLVLFSLLAFTIGIYLHK